MEAHRRSRRRRPGSPGAETQGRAPSGADWITIPSVPRRSRVVIAASLGVAIGPGALPGLAFEPKRLTVGAMALTGRAFEPKRIGVGEMSLTGLRE